MDGFHVERVSEQKADAVVGTPIGQPIPVEGRLASEDEVGLQVGLEFGEQEVELIGLEVAVEQLVARRIDDTDVQAVAMQVDSAVEFVLTVVEVHIMSFLQRVCLSQQHLRLPRATSFLEH